MNWLVYFERCYICWLVMTPPCRGDILFSSCLFMIHPNVCVSQNFCMLKSSYISNDNSSKLCMLAILITIWNLAYSYSSSMRLFFPRVFTEIFCFSRILYMVIHVLEIKINLSISEAFIVIDHCRWVRL